MGSSEEKRAQRAHANTLPPANGLGQNQLKTQVTPESWNTARGRSEIPSQPLQWFDTRIEGECNSKGSGGVQEPAKAQPLEQHLATCDFCHSNISGDRYRCVNCPDFDACSSCFSLVDTQHTPNHRFIRIEKADDYLTVNRPSAAVTSIPTHDGIQCDACHHIIRGIRHKCRQCADYDLCTPCITSGYLDAHVARNPNHEFFNITQPRAATVPFVGNRNVGGQPQRNTIDIPTWCSKPATSNSPEELLFPISQIHLANCDLCRAQITGDRYKCVSCLDFDTCSSCFPTTVSRHPSHRFVRISKAGDYIHLGFAPPLNQLPVHNAYCNACQQTIQGIRFKCTHPFCPDYDLCQNCEALPVPVHPPNHPLMKIKTPIPLAQPGTPPSSPPYPNFSHFSPNVPSAAQLRHEKKEDMADNLTIAGSLLNIGMTLFGGSLGS